MSNDSKINIKPRYGREDLFIISAQSRRFNMNRGELYQHYLEVCEALKLPNVMDHQADLDYTTRMK